MDKPMLQAKVGKTEKVKRIWIKANKNSSDRKSVNIEK